MTTLQHPAPATFTAERLQSLAESHATPLWVYDAGTIRARVERLRMFDTVRFAQKACSNIHILKPEYVDGGKVDEPAAKALICFWTSPEWSLKMAYAGSNPGNLNGFKTKWMKERLDNIKFLDVTTSMLPYGIPFPALPQAPEIMNIIVPDMLQNALTGAMTVDQAADDAAKKVKDLTDGGL